MVNPVSLELVREKLEARKSLWLCKEAVYLSQPNEEISNTQKITPNRKQKPPGTVADYKAKIKP